MNHKQIGGFGLGCVGGWIFGYNISSVYYHTLHQNISIPIRETEGMDRVRVLGVGITKSIQYIINGEQYDESDVEQEIEEWEKKRWAKSQVDYMIKEQKRSIQNQIQYQEHQQQNHQQ